ncbi:MAG: methionyl-tRNA formyltransferase [Phycisphaerae bacterium]|nr:methionyl-tRNA formyltransferase [Phycisphaerae bacterium]
MKVAFFGSGFCAVRSLQGVSASTHEIIRVVTMPPRGAGRGRKRRRTPVADAAGDAGLDVVECADVNADGFADALRRLRPDVLCVVDFGQRIGRDVRGAAPHGAFNMHGSLLPALRGAAPIQWAIIRGHERTGATTFRLVDRMDAGPVYLQQDTPIAPNETAEHLQKRIAAIGAELVVRTLDLLAAGTVEPTAQDESQATHAPRLSKADGVLDFTAPAERVRNRIHGTWPWPGGQAVFVGAARGRVDVVLGGADADNAVAGEAPGALDGELCVACGSGRLRIRRIKPAGGRLMDWRDFVNGYGVREGDRFEKRA